jgi:hypothetical protein
LDTTKETAKTEVETPIDLKADSEKLFKDAKDIVDVIDKKLKSRWIWGNDRKILLLARAIITDKLQHDLYLLRLRFFMNHQLEQNQNFIDLFGTIKKMFDTTEEKAEKIIEQKIGKLLDNGNEMQQDIAKENEILDKILEKMEVQKKKETIEAFKRIDQIRRELLHDIV